MKKLLEYIIKNITGSDKFEVEEGNEEGRASMKVKADSEIVGLIIGKEGRTIKSIRNLLAVKGTLENVSVNIDVESK